MRFFLEFCLLTLLSVKVLAGGKCPQREDIYPCGCVNVRGQYGVTTTVVQCHRLRDTDQLSIIFRSLKAIVADAFHLYDSFWGSENELETRRSLPEDWMITLKSKTIEIVDTPLASCFACNQTFPCKNIETTKLVLRNSTTSSKFCSLCDAGRSNSYPWLNCMSKLKELHITHGRLESLDADLFPRKVEELQALKLSHNQIRTISNKVFENISNLTYLDLSHNRIVYLDGLFPSPLQLQYLDMSWNSIEQLGENFFRNLRHLKSLYIKGNHIVNLVEKHWENPPSNLRRIDVSENPIHCGCNITWLNTTLSKSVFFNGKCATPPYYESHNVRFKANYLIKTCNNKREL